jgi:1-acyl-sn-glycerol-3-phosphate acyltransferase
MSNIKTLVKITIIFLYTCILSVIAGSMLVLPDGDKKYFFFARHWARTILKTFRIKVVIKNLDRIKSDKGNIYVANHASMFDIWAIQANMPGQLRFVGKKEIVKIPIFGWIWQYSGNIPIDRKSPKAFIKSLEKATQTIKNGRCIVLYPEGTRTKDGLMQPFKRGPFSVAIKSQGTIVPITINGSFNLHRKGSLKINPGTIELSVHDPITIPDHLNFSKENEIELMKRVQAAVESDYIKQN